MQAASSAAVAASSAARPGGTAPGGGAEGGRKEGGAQSSMLGVLSRMVAYTGQTITYADALKSDVSLAPPIDQYSWDLKWPGQPVSRPGIDIQF